MSSWDLIEPAKGSDKLLCGAGTSAWRTDDGRVSYSVFSVSATRSDLVITTPYPLGDDGVSVSFAGERPRAANESNWRAVAWLA